MGHLQSFDHGGLARDDLTDGPIQNIAYYLGMISGGSGALALKPASSDAVQYVTTHGNDNNDGLSWGSAKQTVPAAVTASFAAGGSAWVNMGAGTMSLGMPIIPAPGVSGAYTSGAGLTLTLQGAGSRATLLKATNNFSANGIIGYGAGGSTPIVAQVIGRDFSLDGNYSGVGGSIAQPGSNAGALISLPWPDTSATSPFYNGKYHTFENVRFYRPPGYTFQPTQGVKLIACEFDSTGQPDIASGGLHYDNLGSGQGDAIAVGCTWHDSSGNYADFVSTTGMVRLIMLGCESYNHQIGGIYACGTQSVIVGNRLINNVAGSGVGYDAGTSVRSQNMVANNVFGSMLVNASGLSFASYADLVFGNLATDSVGNFFFPVVAPGLAGSLALGSAGIVGGSSGPWILGDGTNMYLETASAGALYLRPNAGANTGMAVVNANGGLTVGNAGTLFTGAGVPSISATNGDIFFRTDGGAGTCIYQRRGGAWVATGA